MTHDHVRGAVCLGRCVRGRSRRRVGWTARPERSTGVGRARPPAQLPPTPTSPPALPSLPLSLPTTTTATDDGLAPLGLRALPAGPVLPVAGRRCTTSSGTDDGPSFSCSTRTAAAARRCQRWSKVPVELTAAGSGRGVRRRALGRKGRPSGGADAQGLSPVLAQRPTRPSTLGPPTRLTAGETTGRRGQDEQVDHRVDEPSVVRGQQRRPPAGGSSPRRPFLLGLRPAPAPDVRRVPQVAAAPAVHVAPGPFAALPRQAPHRVASDARRRVLPAADHAVDRAADRRPYVCPSLRSRS